MTLSLFDDMAHEALCPGAVVLRGFALPFEQAVLEALNAVTRAAPFRHMTTPSGFRMSVAMTNCGSLGWITDRTGYRYTANDPGSGAPWPAMPDALRTLARDAATAAGFDGFDPDACLVNRYEPGAKLSLHQDRDERDLGAPVVSVSLGIPATFLFGGLKRNDKPLRVPLAHGDVVAWGEPARLSFHGIAPLKEDSHPLLGRQRINLTFRKAG